RWFVGPLAVVGRRPLRAVRTPMPGIPPLVLPVCHARLLYFSRFEGDAAGSVAPVPFAGKGYFHASPPLMTRSGGLGPSFVPRRSPLAAPALIPGNVCWPGDGKGGGSGVASATVSSS